VRVLVLMALGLAIAGYWAYNARLSMRNLRPWDASDGVDTAEHVEKMFR